MFSLFSLTGPSCLNVNMRKVAPRRHKQKGSAQLESNQNRLNNTKHIQHVGRTYAELTKSGWQRGSRLAFSISRHLVGPAAPSHRGSAVASLAPSGEVVVLRPQPCKNIRLELEKNYEKLYLYYPLISLSFNNVQLETEWKMKQDETSTMHLSANGCCFRCFRGSINLRSFGRGSGLRKASQTYGLLN